jgi:hypothetical protein
LGTTYSPLFPKGGGEASTKQSHSGIEIAASLALLAMTRGAVDGTETNTVQQLTEVPAKRAKVIKHPER